MPKVETPEIMVERLLAQVFLTCVCGTRKAGKYLVVGTTDVSLSLDTVPTYLRPFVSLLTIEKNVLTAGEKTKSVRGAIDSVATNLPAT